MFGKATNQDIGNGMTIRLSSATNQDRVVKGPLNSWTPPVVAARRKSRCPRLSPLREGTAGRANGLVLTSRAVAREMNRYFRTEAHNKAGVVVKNTFLEVGDHIPSLHDWQLSEPVKIYTSVEADEDVYENDQAEAPEEMPPMPFSMAPPSTSSTHPGPGQLQPNMGAVSPGALPQSPCFEALPQPYVPRQVVRDQNLNKVSRNGPGINALKNNDITSKDWRASVAL
eukprot:symbB.v1.2.006956.t1/scaffold416.1/size293898/15